MVRTAEEQLASTSAFLKAIRANASSETGFYEEELRLAWTGTDLAATFRWSRLLGGRPWGSKKRDYRGTTAALPYKKTWQDQWTKPGAEGGMSATVLGSWLEWRAKTSEKPRAQLPHCQEKTEHLLRSFGRCYSMLRGTCRQRIGYQTRKVEPAGILALVERLLCRVRSSGTAPLAWHHNSGAPLRKSNKPGPKGRRVVHVSPTMREGSKATPSCQFFSHWVNTER